MGITRSQNLHTRDKQRLGYDLQPRISCKHLGGETGSTEVKKFKSHAEVLTARKTVGKKTNADDYAYAVAA